MLHQNLPLQHHWTGRLTFTTFHRVLPSCHLLRFVENCRKKGSEVRYTVDRVTKSIVQQPSKFDGQMMKSATQAEWHVRATSASTSRFGRERAPRTKNTVRELKTRLDGFVGREHVQGKDVQAASSLLRDKLQDTLLETLLDTVTKLPTLFDARYDTLSSRVQKVWNTVCHGEWFVLGRSVMSCVHSLVLQTDFDHMLSPSAKCIVLLGWSTQCHVYLTLKILSIWSCRK